MNRREFLLSVPLIAGLSACSNVVRADSVQIPRARIYPYGRLLKGLDRLDAEITKPVEIDDAEAKQELVKYGSDEVRSREEYRLVKGAVVNWRVADALLALKAEVDTMAPRRSKRDDGFIGDAKHQSRSSDHNPWISEGKVHVVSAFDITNDSAGGCSVQKIVDSLVKSRDRRVKYIIWQRQIVNSEPVRSARGWSWRPYTGPNPHDRHMHLSVLPIRQLYDDRTSWGVTVA